MDTANKVMDAVSAMQSLETLDNTGNPFNQVTWYIIISLVMSLVFWMGYVAIKRSFASDSNRKELKK